MSIGSLTYKEGYLVERVSKNVFIKDLKPKDTVNDLFLLKYLAVMESRDGRSYLNLILSDSSGDIESRKWTNVESVTKLIAKGDVVRVEGKVNLYQGRYQLIVTQIKKIEEKDQEDMSALIPKAETHPDQMFEELLKIVREDLDDVYIRDLLEMVLFDPEVTRRLKIWQAGKTIHHAYQSGLLEHVLSCTTLALTLSKHYKVNKNYVVLGAILHDICKIYELSQGPVVEYSDEGKLVGHLVKSVEIVDHFTSKIKGFPSVLKMHIKHILLAHHGEYEFGSPKLPQTSEAYLVHLIDFMDSKMGAFESVKHNDLNPGKWTGYIKHLDRLVYKEELPFFKEYLPERESPLKETPYKGKKNGGKVRNNPPSPKLGSLLSGFKVEEK